MSARRTLFHLAPDRALAKPSEHPEYFDGHVLMQRLAGPETGEGLEIIAVFFEHGARTIPHVHQTDQLLIVVEGRCLIADASGRHELEAGETALVPAREWHWHGAAPGHSMCHLSVRAPGPTDWNVEKRDW